MTEPQSPLFPLDPPVCPLPHEGKCVGQGCTFWDDEAGHCSSACLGDYSPLETPAPLAASSPCTIPWMDEDGGDVEEMDE